MSPTKILATIFPRTPGQTLVEFSNEVKELRAACPAETKGKSTSFPDFIQECAASIGETVTA